MIGTLWCKILNCILKQNVHTTLMVWYMALWGAYHSNKSVIDTLCCKTLNCIFKQGVRSILIVCYGTLGVLITQMKVYAIGIL